MQKGYIKDLNKEIRSAVAAGEMVISMLIKGRLL